MNRIFNQTSISTNSLKETPEYLRLCANCRVKSRWFLSKPLKKVPAFCSNHTGKTVAYPTVGSCREKQPFPGDRWGKAWIFGKAGKRCVSRCQIGKRVGFRCPTPKKTFPDSVWYFSRRCWPSQKSILL